MSVCFPSQLNFPLFFDFYNGSAGFYFIRDQWGGESGMDRKKNKLPGPPPFAELRNNKNWYVKRKYNESYHEDLIVRELPIAIQDMSFYWDKDKGETRQFYPADHDNFLDEDGEVGVADR